MAGSQMAGDDLCVASLRRYYICLRSLSPSVCAAPIGSRRQPSSSPVLRDGLPIHVLRCSAASGGTRHFYVFAFCAGPLEERSELTNVGALKIAETLEQHDATAKQSVPSRLIDRVFFSDTVARLLVERSESGSTVQSVIFSHCSEVDRPQTEISSSSRRLAAFQFPLGQFATSLILSRADSEFRCRTEDSAAIHDN